MKNLLLTSATLLGLSGLVHATTINAPSALASLEGNDAYSWGISIPVPSGETIASASIDFANVQLTASGNSQGTGVLYTDLLNSQNPGVTTAVDNDAAGDYWSTQFSGKNIVSVGSEPFAKVGQTLSWSYTLNSTELSALNSFLAAGSFNIGIDPDCHFSVGNISFTYSLESTHRVSAPDAAATAFLMVLGVAGLEVFRRQFVAARAKA
jgi:hypothetical protein